MPADNAPARSDGMTALISFAVLLLAVLPAIAVETAPFRSRVIWLSTLLIFFLVIVPVGLMAEAESRERKGPFVLRFRPHLIGLVVMVFLLAELVGIVITYAAVESPLLWSAATGISALGESLFPVVGKFATEIDPLLDPQTLLTAQTITTVFLIAGLLSVLAVVVYLLAMPTDERHQMWKEKGGHQANCSDLAAVIVVPAGVLMAMASFFGWLEFRGGNTGDCIMRTECYAKDDLALVASAFMRTFASFGFGLGAALMLWRAMDASSPVVD